MTDTIAAIATSMAPSGIGIIRMSGDDSLQILSRIFRPKTASKNIEEVPTHTIHYGHIYDGDELMDEVLVMIMRAPNSYTGETTVEIDCHGGILAVRQVLETALKYGARPAEPGEFSKRAFLNGKMDLSKAEAVIDVIQAKNEYALKSSLKQLKGSLEKEIRRIREKLLYHVAFIESALDDPEHVSVDGYGEEILADIRQEQKKIERLISSFNEGKMIHEGIKTVIVGKPNAGKSSLLNMLIGEEKAIVTDIEGTTRDVLEENIMFQGVSLRIIDTAGIRRTDDVVEKIGVSKAREYAKDADLILYVVDSSVMLDQNDADIIRMISEGDKKVIALLNKSDIRERKVSETDLREHLARAPIVEVSAAEKSGSEELESCIKNMFFNGEISFNQEVYITNIRHKQLLDEAKKSLARVIDSINAQMPEDFYSIDLMAACDALGSITGETTGEDLVNEIFSKFCTGK